MYPLEHSSIPHVQKLYQVQLATSTKCNFLDLQWLDLVSLYFYSRETQYSIFFSLHVVHLADINLCINHLQVVRFPMDVPLMITDDFWLLFLLTILLRFLTKMVDTFSGSWSSGASMGLNKCFSSSLLRASTKLCECT